MFAEELKIQLIDLVVIRVRHLARIFCHVRQVLITQGTSSSLGGVQLWDERDALRVIDEVFKSSLGLLKRVVSVVCHPRR